MVGFGSSFRLRSIALIVFALAKFSASPPAAMRRIQPRSAPAEKATPRPVRTTIRVLPSAPSDLKASVSEWMTLSSIALRTCGRLIATVATPRASLVMRTQASLISGRLRHRRLSTREMSDCTISCSAQTRSEVASKLGFVCGNRRRPQKPLEPGRREHDEIVILDVSGIAQLVGNVARSDESVASPENKGLAADDDFQFSGEDIVRLVLTRMGMTRHCHARRETDVQETVCSSRYRRPT